MRNTQLLGRLAVVLGACLSLPALLCGPAAAAGSGPTPPTISRTEAVWKIPKSMVGDNIKWTMKLWTCPLGPHCSTKLLGEVTKESGTLRIAVPPVPNCNYQVNVLRQKKVYVAKHATFTPCSASAQTTTTTSGASTTGTSGGSTTGTSGGSGPSGTTSTGGSQPTPSSGSLAFTGAGLMLDVLAGMGTLLAIGGGFILWYVRPRRPRPIT